jgi:hypothetical protein
MKDATVPLSLVARTEELDWELARNEASWRWLDKWWCTRSPCLSRERAKNDG